MVQILVDISHNKTSNVDCNWMASKFIFTCWISASNDSVQNEAESRSLLRSTNGVQGRWRKCADLCQDELHVTPEEDSANLYGSRQAVQVGASWLAMLQR